MKPLLCFGLLCILFLFNNLFALTSESAVNSTTTARNTTVVGGWYPVFFDSYDQVKVNAIIKTIQEKRVSRIVVSYDQNLALAEQLISAISSKVNFVIEKNQTVIKDTATTRYNHIRVVVTVYLKNKNGFNQ